MAAVVRRRRGVAVPLLGIDVDLVSFESLASGSETFDQLKVLQKATRARLFRTTEKVTAVCPQVDLSDGWEQVLDRSKRKANFQRRVKALERTSGYEFRSLV